MVEIYGDYWLGLNSGHKLGYVHKIVVSIGIVQENR